MRLKPLAVAGVILAAISAARADDIIYRYECDVLPYDPSAGWIPRECVYPCSESIEDGQFIVRWAEVGFFSQYIYRITVPPQQDPPSLWVEWNFRSDQALGPIFYSCDGAFRVDYAGASPLVNMYGDAAMDFGANNYVLGLDLNNFHTYRFESPDGIQFWVSVDGLVFFGGSRASTDGYSSLLMVSDGGCSGEPTPIENAWDFVRYGTMVYGEQIVGSNPAAGFLDARVHAGLDRFIITYDQPNYAYIDEITVDMTPSDLPLGSFVPVSPSVVATRRRDNAPAEELQIVLDRPIPFNATTTFTFDDGALINIVQYTFAPGDTDGDGDADLSDYARLQTCSAESPLASGPCLALDANADSAIDLADSAAFAAILSGPR